MSCWAECRSRPLVVAHRGSSGYRPEHTLAAYRLAIQQGADYIEPDLVSTRDGALVARHENEIGETTDVASRPEFARRRTTKLVDNAERSGWFTEDFTLAELKTLRARERLQQTRPANADFDGQYPLATLDEILDLAAAARTRDGERVGVYLETKHPSYFRSLGLPLEEPMLAALDVYGYGDAAAPVFLQSFETANLRRLAATTCYRLIQLIEVGGGPFDLVVAGEHRTYADLVTGDGLREISDYAYGVGLPKPVMIPRDAAGRLLEPTPVIANAHRCGLQVHGWTFRRENFFLPLQYRRGTDPNGTGDLLGEIDAFLAAGMDGIFVDNPDLVVWPGH
jgi:glycerophosphoryl diester phosphodiesterase